MTERGGGTQPGEASVGGGAGAAVDALAAATDGAVLRFDADASVAGVDDEFVERTGLAAGAATGDPSTVFGSQSVERVRRLVAAGDAGTAVVRLTDHAGGGVYELSLEPVGDGSGVDGAVGVLQPTDRPTDAAKRERVLREFYEATVDRDRPFEERVADVLGIVREALGTEYASLSSVDGDEYTFEVVDAIPDGEVREGDTLAVSQTNCERVVESEETVVLRDLRADAPDLAARSGNVELGLSCFMGAPVYVNGDVYGTFCFFGTETAEGRFSEWETTVVDIAARWVGAELSRRRTRARLERSNEELAAKERRYRTLVENFPNGGVGVYDEDLRYSLVDGTMWDDIEVDASDLEGRTIWEALPESTAAAVEPVFRAALHGETDSVVAELGGRTYRVWATPLRNADGEITAGQSFALDVTEQREHERDLQKRARQQAVVAELGRKALDSGDIAELMREATRRVADVLDNEYAKVLDLDSADGELLLREGAGWSEDVVGSATIDADADGSQAGYTLQTEQPVVVERFQAESRFSAPDLLVDAGAESGISTLVGSVEEPWGIFETHDTTSQAFTEEDVNFVQSVANVLADAIERDRYDREREQLVAELEASNERLEQFAYAASHDLQEPLRMVSSYLSLVDRRYRDELDEDGREFIEYAVDGAERMQEMIRALLEYSRVETRGGSLKPVSLDDVFADVRRDFEVRIEESDATVHVESLPTVRGDADQLRQVLANLLSNAIEYSGDDPPEVWVSAERDGTEWVVSVRDDGIGIDDEHADSVFEVFERLHSHDEHPGTGIGLALVQRIVERHGGEIWVESEPGEGSTFSFTVPAATSDGGETDD